MRGKDLRLESNEDKVTWVSMRGTKWAKWGSLSPFRVDSTRKMVMAKVVGPDVSPKVAADGVFTLSAQLLDLDETELAKQLNGIRGRALGEALNPSS